MKRRIGEFHLPLYLRGDIGDHLKKRMIKRSC
jgi:hypothetical protein